MKLQVCVSVEYDYHAVSFQYHGLKIQLNMDVFSFELAYAEHFGVALVPASYGYPSVAALLQAIPHVANIRGKGYRRTVLLCQDFQGEI